MLPLFRDLLCEIDEESEGMTCPHSVRLFAGLYLTAKLKRVAPSEFSKSLAERVNEFSLVGIDDPHCRLKYFSLLLWAIEKEKKCDLLSIYQLHGETSRCFREIGFYAKVVETRAQLVKTLALRGYLEKPLYELQEMEIEEKM